MQRLLFQANGEGEDGEKGEKKKEKEEDWSEIDRQIEEEDKAKTK